jgi:integration host factor subunit beta
MKRVGQWQSQGGDRKSKSNAATLIPEIAELDITKDRSSQWQQTALASQYREGLTCSARQTRIGAMRTGNDERLLTRRGLIDEVKMATQSTHADAKAIVEAIFAGLVRALRAGDRAEIRGFGSFGTRLRRGRIGRNPKTGARVSVPPKRVPFFKPGRELKALVLSGGSTAAQRP